MLFRVEVGIPIISVVALGYDLTSSHAVRRDPNEVDPSLRQIATAKSNDSNNVFELHS